MFLFLVNFSQIPTSKRSWLLISLLNRLISFYKSPNISLWKGPICKRAHEKSTCVVIMWPLHLIWMYRMAPPKFKVKVFLPHLGRRRLFFIDLHRYFHRLHNLIWIRGVFNFYNLHIQFIVTLYTLWHVIISRLMNHLTMARLKSSFAWSFMPFNIVLCCNL